MTAPSNSFPCRLCRRPLSPQQAADIGPFPIAAQYYPTPAEFEADRGTLLHLVECPGCGLTQLTNEPVDYYKQVISAASMSPTLRTHRLAMFGDLRSQIKAAQPATIEIGCGNGDNLPLLAEAGFVPTGVEYNFSPPPERPNLHTVLDTYITDIDPARNGSFDLLVSFNYLEHQPDTQAFLDRCRELLKPDGMALITVPNLNYLIESKSAHEFVTDHLVYFTPASLTNALSSNGFEVLSTEIINNQYDILIIARKRTPTRIKGCAEALEQLVVELNAKLKFHADQGQKVAVWGAGHRTLALLSLSEYRLIDCVIDSAKFKHYRYTPISHLEILPPEILLDNRRNIDVILVMVPGIYPNEVIQKIKSFEIDYIAEKFPADPDDQ